jgi:hypothetical protein
MILGFAMIKERQVWVKQISMKTASPGSAGKEVKDNIYSSQGRYNRLTFKWGGEL